MITCSRNVNFLVPPAQCQALRGMGLTPNTMMHWRRDNGQEWYAVLDSAEPQADLERVLPVGVRNVSDILPAYLVSDLLEAIPDVFLNRMGDIWEVSTHRDVSQTVCTHTVQGIAVAHMVLHLLRFRRINVPLVNRFLCCGG